MPSSSETEAKLQGDNRPLPQDREYAVDKQENLVH